MKKYWSLMSLVVLLAVACDGSGPSKEEELPPPEGPGGGISACLSNENCPAGEICYNNACITPSSTSGSISGCSSDSECQTGQYCSNGSCVAKEAEGPQEVPPDGGSSGCTGNENCGQGQKCENGTCVAAVPTCLAGEILINDVCKRNGMVNMPCKDGGICDPGLKCNAEKICLGTEEWTHLGKKMVFPALADGTTVRVGNVTYVGTISGVFKTSDSGVTWLPANNGLPGSAQVTSLIAIGQNIYASLFSEGVYFTSDGGLNWSPVNAGLSSNGKFISSMLRVTVSKTGLFYAGTREGVFSAPSQTPTEWKNIGLKDMFVVNLAYYNSKLYALAVDEKAISPKGIFVYGSDGTWSEANDGLKDPETGALKPIFSMAVSTPLGLVVATQDGIYQWKPPTKLEAKGKWLLLALGLTDIPFILSPAGDELYIAVFGGVLYKYAGGKLLMIGLEGKPSIKSITLVDDKIFVVTSKGIYKTKKDNINWELTEYDIGYDYIMNSMLVNNTLVAGTDSRGLAYSSNGGASWTYLQLGDKYDHIDSIKQNNNMTYAISTNVLQSTDGINWAPMSGTTLFKAYDFTFFNDVLFVGNGKDVYKFSDPKMEEKLTPLPSDVISLAAFKGEVYAGTKAGLYKLVNGNSWILAGLQDEVVSALFPNENDLYVGSFSGIRRFSATDAGLQQQSLELEGFKIADIKIFGNDIYAATNLGLYKAAKGNDNWSHVKELADIGFITSLSATKEMLFAGTLGLGLYVFVP